MQMIIIAGQAGVGKSTLAKLIAEEVFRIGQVPVLLSFAGPLKEEAKRRGYSKEDNPEKYREYCQEIGNARREEEPDYWVEKFDKELQKVLARENKDIKEGAKYWERVIIVDDCRYVNELAYGVLYNATTLFMSYGDREFEDHEWRSHPSEYMCQSLEGGKDTLLHQFSDVVFNDGTKKDLKKLVKANFPVWCGAEIEIDGYEPSIPMLKEMVEDLLASMDLDIEELDDEETEDGDN